MRVRNGAPFLEPTIRSHIDFFDEIVVVHNQCTDETPTILARLQQEYGPKLRVYHYVDRVFPPGSEGHISKDGNSPNSIVNYYNCALALTRFQVATKLDDDHLAITSALSTVVKDLQRVQLGKQMLCFSGLNLISDKNNALAVPSVDPVSGGGDIGFFQVSWETYFSFDPRFERFRANNLHRKFAGYLYWHLKYLKPGAGFANYELGSNPNSRYLRKQERFLTSNRFVYTMQEVRKLLPVNLLDQFAGHFNEKRRLICDRNAALLPTFGDGRVDHAVHVTSNSSYLSNIATSD